MSTELILVRQENNKWGKEATYGVEAPSVDPIKGALDFKMEPVIEEKDNESQLGVTNKVNNSVTTQKYADISITKKIEFEEIGHDLMALLGTVSTSADDPEVGVNVHTFTQKQDQDQPSYTFKNKTGYRDQMVLGARMNTISFKFPIDDYAQYETNYLGKYFSTTTETANVYTDEWKEVTGLRAKIYLADDVAGLAAATGEDWYDTCSIDFNKNTITLPAFGSANHTDPLQPRAIVNTAFDKTACAVEKYQDKNQTIDYRELAELKTTKALKIEIINPDITIGLASNPKLTFIFPQVKVTGYKDSDAGLDDLKKETFSFDGQYSVSEGYQVEVQLTNTTATY